MSQLGQLERMIIREDKVDLNPHMQEAVEIMTRRAQRCKSWFKLIKRVKQQAARKQAKGLRRQLKQFSLDSGLPVESAEELCMAVRAAKMAEDDNLVLG
jgi:hypothetical protein